MRAKKRKALEAAGWKFGDAADFVGMSDEERQLLDARVEMALAVRRQRESQHLSQQQLAKKINTSQPRITKIERAAPDVSLDQIIRAFTAAGGKIVVGRVGRSGSGGGKQRANSQGAAANPKKPTASATARIRLKLSTR